MLETDFYACTFDGWCCPRKVEAFGLCPSESDVREHCVDTPVVVPCLVTQAVDDIDDCAVGDCFAFGPVSPAVERVDSMFDGFESFGVVAPAFDLVVAVVVTSCRCQVRPRCSAGFAGRSCLVLGCFEGLGGFGESCIGVSDMDAGSVSTEASGGVEVVLRATLRVLGLFHLLGGGVDDHSRSTTRFFSAPGGTRTPNRLIRSQMLYPLSYER